MYQARIGDAAAASGSGRQREDLWAAAGTAGRDVAAQRGDTTVVRESVQPQGRPRGGGWDRVSWHYGRRGDAAVTHESMQPQGEPRGGGAAARRGYAAAA